MSLFTNSNDMDTTGDKPNDNDFLHLKNLLIRTIHTAHYAQQLCTQAIDDLTAELAQVNSIEDDDLFFTPSPGHHNPMPHLQLITTKVLVEWQWAFAYNDNQLIFTRPQTSVQALQAFLAARRHDLQQMIVSLQQPIHDHQWETVHNGLSTVNSYKTLIDETATWAKTITNTATQNTQRIRNTLETIDNNEYEHRFD
jgi:hypothetical protein